MIEFPLAVNWLRSDVKVGITLLNLSVSINLFHATVLFLCPLKTSRDMWERLMETKVYTSFFAMSETKELTSLTKVKLPQFGQPEPGEIWPLESLVKNYEITKSYKVTEKPNNISIIWLKRALWFGFWIT